MLEALTLGRDRHSGNCLVLKVREVRHIWGIRLYTDVFHYHLIFVYLGRISGLFCFSLAVSLLPNVFVYPYETSSLFLQCVLTEILLCSSLS